MKKMRLAAIVFCAATMFFGSAEEASAQSFLDILKGAASSMGSQSDSTQTSSGSTSVLGDILSSVLGSSTITESDLEGTWRYNGSDCAFSSDNLLAKAGGEVAAEKIESELNGVYSKANITSSNTSYTFNSDKTFKMTIAGKSLSGTYTLDAKNSKIEFKGKILKLTGYVKKSGSTISILYDSTKLLVVLQTVANISGNSSLKTIGTLSKNYSGVKLGFELKK